MNTNTKKTCKYCKSEIILSAKKCPECQSDLRNWFVRHWIISTVLILIILGIAVSDTSKEKTGTTNSNKTSPITETKTEKKYIEVAKFSGNGHKTSEPFTITGNRFKIAYDCKGDTLTTLCQAFVYKVGSQLPQGVMNSTQAVKDETVIYGSGEYYIDANTMGSFTMTIYDYK